MCALNTQLASDRLGVTNRCSRPQAHAQSVHTEEWLCRCFYKPRDPSGGGPHNESPTSAGVYTTIFGSLHVELNRASIHGPDDFCKGSLRLVSVGLLGDQAFQIKSMGPKDFLPGSSCTPYIPSENKGHT